MDITRHFIFAHMRFKDKPAIPNWWKIQWMCIVKVAFKATIFLPFAHRICTMPWVPIFFKRVFSWPASNRGSATGSGPRPKCILSLNRMCRQSLLFGYLAHSTGVLLTLRLLQAAQVLSICTNSWEDSLCPGSSTFTISPKRIRYLSFQKTRRRYKNPLVISPSSTPLN